MRSLDVVKHNSLIDATSSHTFSQFEQQFIAEALSKISMNDNELKNTAIDIDNLYEEINGLKLDGTSKKEVYSNLEELTEKSITVHSDGRRVTFPWFSLFEYDKIGKKATIHVNEKAAEFLLQLTNDFTKIEVEAFKLMNNTYGTRLLELMSKVYGSVSQRKFEIKKLRKMLHVGDKYDSTYDFKRYVIEPAIEEVNDVADFTLTYEQLKPGRRITHIKFTKHSKKGLEANAEKEFDIEAMF